MCWTSNVACNVFPILFYDTRTSSGTYIAWLWCLIHDCESSRVSKANEVISYYADYVAVRVLSDHR